MIDPHAADEAVEFAWQVTDLATGRTAGEYVDQLLPIASLAKVPLLVVAVREAELGHLDLAERFTLTPDGRAQGTTGISAMRDPITISLRDAAYLALTISDNAAADAIWDALRPGAIQEHLHALGLNEIRLVQPMREIYDTHAASSDSRTSDTNAATPRSLVHLLAGLWDDAVASPEHCAWIRELMSRQVWHERIAPAFAAPDIQVAAKSGTVGPLRHEMAVISYPHAQHYAAVVLSNALTAHPSHRTDVLIGEAAKQGVLSLRRGGRT